MAGDLSRPDLWEIIHDHFMPEDASGQSFTGQLAEKAGIKRETARRAIEEYRRFIYLVALGEGRRVPSEAVDTVWHLHMQHTRDYWDVFCASIGRPIHHTPGGETAKGSDDVVATEAAYRREFGEEMPRGIWRRRNRRGERIAGYIGIAGMGGAVAIGAFTALPFVALGVGLASGFLILMGRAGIAGDFGIEIEFDPTDYWGDSAAGACGGDGGGDGGCGGD
ncbi:hypothetical protein HKCCE2091_10885 [Rhodobacterales bacterium HKCCE2091]|nr:hypothetical protein [Rhodobacterales bacterium HKCCE2091]